MPEGVAYIKIPVAAGVVEVVSQHRRADIVDARVVDQRAEVLVQVDELDERGALLAVVLLPEVPSAVIGPDLLEGAGDPVDVVGEQPRKGEVAERIEERELVIGESHFCSFSYSSWGFDPGVRS